MHDIAVAKGVDLPAVPVRMKMRTCFYVQQVELILQHRQRHHYHTLWSCRLAEQRHNELVALRHLINVGAVGCACFILHRPAPNNELELPVRNELNTLQCYNWSHHYYHDHHAPSL